MSARRRSSGGKQASLRMRSGSSVRQRWSGEVEELPQEADLTSPRSSLFNPPANRRLPRVPFKKRGCATGSLFGAASLCAVAGTTMVSAGSEDRPPRPSPMAESANRGWRRSAGGIAKLWHRRRRNRRSQRTRRTPLWSPRWANPPLRVCPGKSVGPSRSPSPSEPSGRSSRSEPRSASRYWPGACIGSCVRSSARYVVADSAYSRPRRVGIL